jgi:hypothetical protein
LPVDGRFPLLFQKGLLLLTSRNETGDVLQSDEAKTQDYLSKLYFELRHLRTASVRLGNWFSNKHNFYFTDYRDGKWLPYDWWNPGRTAIPLGVHPLCRDKWNDAYAGFDNAPWQRCM